MILLQHRAKRRRNTLRQEYWNSRSDPQELHMLNGAQAAQQRLQFFITKEQRVTSAEQNVSDTGCAADIIDLALELGMEIVTRGITHQAGPGAIAAICRATVGNQK